uniref:Protein kinase domain-containing protein n=1 Tax=Arion vulgaris TaxID=1028688 RepID=A0A0B7AC98_9EUPU
MAANNSHSNTNNNIVSADESILIHFCGGIPSKQVPTNIDTILTCEKVLEICINYIQYIVYGREKIGQIYGQKYLPTFGLVACPEEVIWIPLNHIFKKNTEKERKYKLRVRFRPPADQFHDNIMCEYLFLQTMDDFLMGPLGKDPELESKTLFGLLQIAFMIPTTLPLNSATLVDEKFKSRNFKVWNFTKFISREVARRFISQPLVDHFWVYKTIKERIHKYKRHSPPVPLGYYKKELYRLLMEAVPKYCFEEYRVSTVTVKGIEMSSVNLCLYKENGMLDGLYYGEQYQCSLKDIYTIKLNKPKDLSDKKWQVMIDVCNGPPKILLFEEEGLAESFITMIQGYFKLCVRYDTCLCRELQTTGSRISTELKSFGPIGRHTAESYLEDSLSVTETTIGWFLIHESLTNFGQYEAVCRFKINQSERQSDSMNAKKLIKSGIIEYLDATEFRLKMDGIEKTFGNCIELRRHLTNEFGQQVCPRNLSRVADIHDDFQVEEDYYGCDTSQEDVKSTVSISLPIIKDDLTDMILIPDKNPLVLKYEVYFKTEKMMLVELQSEEGAYAKSFREGFEKLIKWYRIKDSCFLKFYNLVLDPQFSVLMEYVPDKDVLTYVCNKSPTVAQMVHIMDQIIKILIITERAKIFHGNLRLRKFMVFPSQNADFVTIKLGDPGISSYFDTLSLEYKGNVERTPWLSPERRTNLRKITSESEVYAVGTTFCELLYRNDQFHELLNLGTNQNIQTYLDKNKQLPQPAFLAESCVESITDDPEGKSYVPEAKDVLNIVWKICLRCWAEDETDRPTTTDLLNDMKELKDKADAIEADTIFETIQNVAYDIGIPKQKNERKGNGQKRAELTKLFHKHLQNKYLAESCIDLNYIKKMGSGHFGSVWEGRVRAPETDLQQLDKNANLWTTVAVKRIKHLGSDRRSLYKEVVTACELDHPNIVKLFYLSIGPINPGKEKDRYDPLMLIMELMNQGSLSSYAKKLGNLHSPELVSHMLRILLDVAVGMVYLSGKGMVHRDLAARNILLTKDEDGKITAKVSDFGLARMTEDNYRFYRGKASEELPLFCMPPECLAIDELTSKFSSQGDVWSFGTLIWEAFSNGDTPRSALNLPKIDGLELLEKYKNKYRLPKNIFMSQAVYGLMEKCWNMEQRLRPPFVDLVQILNRFLQDPQTLLYV